MNGITSNILILALATVVMSAYTLIGMTWWLKNRNKLLSCLPGPPLWRDLLSLAFSVIAVAATIAVPGLLLAYLMGKVKAETLGQNGAFIVLGAWIFPTPIYFLIRVIRQSRRR